MTQVIIQNYSNIHKLNVDLTEENWEAIKKIKKATKLHTTQIINHFLADGIRKMQEENPEIF